MLLRSESLDREADRHRSRALEERATPSTPAKPAYADSAPTEPCSVLEFERSRRTLPPERASVPSADLSGVLLGLLELHQKKAPPARSSGLGLDHTHTRRVLYKGCAVDERAPLLLLPLSGALHKQDER